MAFFNSAVGVLQALVVALLVVMEISLVMITAGTGVLEGILDVACDNLGSFMRS